MNSSIQLHRDSKRLMPYHARSQHLRVDDNVGRRFHHARHRRRRLRSRRGFVHHHSLVGHHVELGREDLGEAVEVEHLLDEERELAREADAVAVGDLGREGSASVSTPHLCLAGVCSIAVLCSVPKSYRP